MLNIKTKLIEFIRWVFRRGESSPVERFLKKAKKDLKTRKNPRLDMRFDPLAMDDTWHGPRAF